MLDQRPIHAQRETSKPEAENAQPSSRDRMFLSEMTAMRSAFEILGQEMNNWGFVSKGANDMWLGALRRLKSVFYGLESVEYFTKKQLEMRTHSGQVEEQDTTHQAIVRKIQSASIGIRRALGILSAPMEADEPPAAPLINAQFEVRGIIAALASISEILPLVDSSYDDPLLSAPPSPRKCDETFMLRRSFNTIIALTQAPLALPVSESPTYPGTILQSNDRSSLTFSKLVEEALPEIDEIVCFKAWEPKDVRDLCLVVSVVKMYIESTACLVEESDPFLRQTMKSALVFGLSISRKSTEDLMYKRIIENIYQRMQQSALWGEIATSNNLRSSFVPENSGTLVLPFRQINSQT